MADFDRWSAGQFCWIELGTTDIELVKSFYAELFGWSYRDVEMSESMVYRIPQIRGHDVAGMYNLGPDQTAAGVPPAWLPYVCVEDADGTIERARALGATVLAGPFDVYDLGRMAVMQDPTGATVALWQPRKHIGYTVARENGTVVWTELATRDTTGATSFYSGLFGWTAKAWGGEKPYTMFELGGAAFSGMYLMGPEFEGIPPHWMTYFSVADCDASAAKAKALGGAVVMGPQDIPKVGRFAVIRDPSGAVFAIIKTIPM